MKRVKELLRAVFYRYCIVFTLIMLVNLLMALAGGHIEESFSIKTLLGIELMAILSGLGDLFFFVGGELSKGQELFRHILHYSYINIIVFILAFQTMKMTAGNVVLLLVTIAVIYWINFIADFYNNKKDASKMNDLLEKINNND